MGRYLEGTWSHSVRHLDSLRTDLWFVSVGVGMVEHMFDTVLDTATHGPSPLAAVPSVDEMEQELLAIEALAGPSSGPPVAAGSGS